MTEEYNKEFEMAVGTSNVLESGMMEGENFYTPIESANESETASQNNWSGAKNDTGQLCRSCANSSDYLIPIYEGEGLEHQLEYKIQKHMPIQVSSTDTLPLQLCYQCASTLIAWDSMISSCLEAEKKLKAMQEEAEESKHSEFYEDSHLAGDTEMVDSDDEPLISSKNKILSDKNKATPLKKKILYKAKSKNVSLKNEKTANNSKEGEDKERCKSTETQNRSDNILKEFCSNGGVEREQGDETLTYGETQVNLIRANIFKRRTVKSSLKRWVKCPHCLTMFSTKASLARHLKKFNCKEESKELNSLSYLSLSEIKEAIYGSKFKKKADDKNCVSYLKENVQVQQSSNGNQRVGEAICDEEKSSGIINKGSELELISCEFCSKTFTQKQTLNAHLVTHRRQQHLCPVCGKQFSYKSSLVAHQNVHQKLPRSHACEQCNAAFTTIRSLRRHYFTHCTSGDKEFICELCGKRFAYSMTLKNHKLSHSEERPHVCRICGTSFKRTTHLRTHEQGVHGLHEGVKPKKYTCAVCEKSMVKKESLEAHMKEHTGELNYQCKDCHKKFATNTGLNIHIAMERCFPRTKSCNVCIKDFRTDEPMCEHLRAKSLRRKATRIKTKQMNEGEKTTKKKLSAIPRHMKEKNHFCKVCGKHYIYPSELKTHFRLAHTDEKPYVCGKCGKAFKTKATLQMHEDVHNDLRPHKCDMCQKRFRKTEHLKLHIRTHTGEKPHVCEICGRGFAQKGDMKKHILKTHNKPSPEKNDSSLND